MIEYFYNEILRKTIIGFGTLFNAMEIQQEGSVVRIPLAYGPTQKFLARIEQSPDLNKPMAITLPRMSFEFTGLTYDPARKVSTVQQFIVKDPDDESETKKAYMPVPYNMSFELAIMTKLNDDALQIVEQGSQTTSKRVGSENTWSLGCGSQRILCTASCSAGGIL